MIRSPEYDAAIADLQKNLPLRVLLRKADDGNYMGQVEHSFHLDWSRRLVKVEWSGTAYSFIGTHTLDAAKNAEREVIEYKEKGVTVEAYDPLSPECPIEVDFVTWVRAFKSPTANKFDRRNAPFKMKEKS